MVVNRVELKGRVTGTPTVKEIGGSKILTFSVAVSENYTAKNGEKREVVHYFDIEAVGRAASMNLEKGDIVVVDGALRQDRWETPSGEKRSRVKIVAFKVVPQNLPKVPEKAPEPEKTKVAETTAETKKKTKKSKAVAT